MLSPAPEKKILRRMDYISDQKGILRRYMREKKGWSEHIVNAGNFITEITERQKFRHILVLGSGWLLDLPLEKILPSVEKITLVDVFFPLQIQRIVKDIKKVECIPADITGGCIRSVYEGLKSKGSEFSIPVEITQPLISPEPGMLILSLNILNQLDILLVDYILKKTSADGEIIRNFRKNIQEAHIRMLSEHPFILISDYREILINNEGKALSERELIFTEFPSGIISKEWEWEFDTHQLYNPDADTRMKVLAVYSPGPAES